MIFRTGVQRGQPYHTERMYHARRTVSTIPENKQYRVGFQEGQSYLTQKGVSLGLLDHPSTNDNKSTD